LFGDCLFDLLDVDVEQVGEHADIKDIDDHFAQPSVFADGHHELVEGHDVDLEVVAFHVGRECLRDDQNRAGA
jgi:hypothetical protein